jgi:hypothetical protein
MTRITFTDGRCNIEEIDTEVTLGQWKTETLCFLSLKRPGLKFLIFQVYRIVCSEPRSSLTLTGVRTVAIPFRPCSICRPAQLADDQVLFPFIKKERVNVSVVIT